MTAIGPFHTEKQARAASLYAQTAAGQGANYRGSITIANLGDLANACQRAGVELGDYDQRIVRWLAQYEPATVAVVAGLISRAHEAGTRAHLTGSEGG